MADQSSWKIFKYWWFWRTHCFLSLGWSNVLKYGLRKSIGGAEIVH